MHTRKKVAHYLTYLMLIIFSSGVILPVLWILRTSLATKGIIFKIPPEWIFRPIMENYAWLFTRLNFLLYMRNSLIVALTSTLLAVPVAFIAAYAFSRFNTGGKLLQFGTLGSQMLPPIVLVLPIFVIFRDWGLQNNLWSLILVYLSFNVPFLIWLLMGFLEGIPLELEEAALIDGASRMTVIFRIVFPLASPGIMASFVLGFILCWNEFLFGLILVAQEASTIPVKLAALQTEIGTLWGPLSAGVCLGILPMIVLSLTVQKYLVRGLTFGAIK
ncbi:MAG: carbohydrate ABC transporter permease [Candidatus Aerophobus sp.]|nr:MAG: carbohydrate ABC transporter permease [Candidatus Aerophobus sp.]